MSDRLNLQHEAVRRWLPPVVVFVAAFGVTASTSGKDPERVVAPGAVAEPVKPTPSAPELRSVEPLPDPPRRHRRPRAADRPQVRAPAWVVAPRRDRPAEWTVATDAPTAPTPAPPRPAATPLPPVAPPPAAPPPVAAPPPATAVPPRAAPQTTPVAPSPTFDSSGSFDSSG